MTMIAADYGFGLPRVRCGHARAFRLLFLGGVAARCWREAHPGTDFCPPHEVRGPDLMRSVTPECPSGAAKIDAPVYLVCPAPTSHFFSCGRPLPCTSHAVVDAAGSLALYGEARVRVPSRRERRAAKKAVKGNTP